MPSSLHEAEIRWIESGHNGLYYHLGCRWKERLTFAQLNRFI